MMATNENPTLSLTDLSLLEQKIKSGSADKDDYESLNAFMTSLGLTDFLVNKLKELNVNSFEEYVIRVNGYDKGSSLESKFRGAVLGVIAALKSILK